MVFKKSRRCECISLPLPQFTLQPRKAYAKEGNPGRVYIQLSRRRASLPPGVRVLRSPKGAKITRQRIHATSTFFGSKPAYDRNTREGSSDLAGIRLLEIVGVI